MSKLESAFVRKIMPLLHALPGSFFERIEQKSIRGTADIIGCINGYYVRLEAKRSEHETTKPLQAYMLQKSRNAGGFSRRIDPQNWLSVYKELKELSNQKIPHVLPAAD